jgi:hypothetical protein
VDEVYGASGDELPPTGAAREVGSDAMLLDDEAPELLVDALTVGSGGGAADGLADGAADGLADGAAEGLADGLAEGEGLGGVVLGFEEGLVDGGALVVGGRAEGDVDAEGGVDGEGAADEDGLAAGAVGVGVAVGQSADGDGDGDADSTGDGESVGDGLALGEVVGHAVASAVAAAVGVDVGAAASACAASTGDPSSTATAPRPTAPQASRRVGVLVDRSLLPAISLLRTEASRAGERGRPAPQGACPTTGALGRQR